MHESPPPTDDPHPTLWYAIRVTGRLDRRWADTFEGLTLSSTGDGTTILSGRVVDQAALHSLLRRVRDLGLHLVSVTQLDPR